MAHEILDHVDIVGNPSSKEVFESIEKELLQLAIIRAHGNCSYAAEILGMNRTTLGAKRRKYGLEIKPSTIKEVVYDHEKTQAE